LTSTDRHPVNDLPADPAAHSFSRHFPTFYFLWKCVLSFRNWLWRRRRAIASAMLVAALSLVVLYGCFETVVGPQRDAVAAIRKAGGSIAFDWEWTNGRPAPPGAEPPWPSWLVKILGRDVFGHVVAVHLVGRHTDNTLLTHIGRLTHLEHLNLRGTTLTESSLAQLEKLTDLEMLALPNQSFSDSDLAHLAGLTRLKELNLVGTQITNRGLAHLAEMRQMESLRLINTNVTTLEPIRGLTQLKVLNLAGSPISDEGLRPLEDFTSLQWLSLGGTLITDAGVAHLSTLSNLWMLDLDNTCVGDAGVRILFDLPRITSLNLYETRVTDAGLADLAGRMYRPLQNLVVAGPGVTAGGVDVVRKKLPRVHVLGPNLVVRPL
jgi:Leucine Rich repeat